MIEVSQGDSPAGWTRSRQDWSASRVIVAGHITVEPQQRESYLAGCVRIVEQARRVVGCLDVAICAWSMLTVSVQEYDIADVRAVFGEGAD